MVFGFLLIYLGLQGFNYVFIIVCIIGIYSIGMVVCNIVYGEVDVMVVGGFEMVVCGFGLGGFGVVCVFFICNDELICVSCLWDWDCDGFVLFDGFGVLVFEELEYVCVCGVWIYVELVGFGMSGDVFYMIVLLEDGVGVVCCMKNVLCDVGLDFCQVDYINVYGIFILVGDIVEIVVVKSVFGEYVYVLLMSLIKLMIGYLLGVVGVVEVIFSVLVLCDQVVLLIINLDNLDEGCDFDLVVYEVKLCKIDVVLLNLFGFGGINGILVFCRFVD